MDISAYQFNPTRFDLKNGHIVESPLGVYCDYVEVGMAVDNLKYWAEVEKERAKKAWEEVDRLRREIHLLEEELMVDDA